MDASLQRCWRHLCQNLRSAQRAFPNAVLHRIDQAIERGRRGHMAEVHVVIESALPLRVVWRGRSPRARALEVFTGIGVWDTEDNNGVLLYLLLADRAVEIVADRAAAARIHERQWGEICSALSDSCRVGNFETGMLAALERIDMLLVDAFPRPVPGTAPLRLQREEPQEETSGRSREEPHEEPYEESYAGDVHRIPEEPVRLTRPVAPSKVVLIGHYGLPEKEAAREPARESVAETQERVVGLE